MQCGTESPNLITDEQRESHEWLMLMRKLRRIGLHEAAARLKQTLDLAKLRNEPRH